MSDIIELELQSEEKPIAVEVDDEAVFGGYEKGYTEGQANGYNNGYTEGEENGLTQGIAQGKQAEVKRWWTLYQRPAYNPFRLKYAGSTWNANTFTPQYSDFVKGTGRQMFLQNAVPNIKAAYAKTGSVLDISACTSGEQMFANALTQELGIMDMSLLTASNTTMEMYAYNASLWKIEKIICVAQTNFANSTFGGLSGLIKIRFEGEIGKSINFQWSTKLSVESMKSIILHLKNYSGTSNESIYSVKFASACWEALEADSTSPTGTTWEEYVLSLGWTK